AGLDDHQHRRQFLQVDFLNEAQDALRLDGRGGGQEQDAVRLARDVPADGVEAVVGDGPAESALDVRLDRAGKAWVVGHQRQAACGHERSSGTGGRADASGECFLLLTLVGLRRLSSNGMRKAGGTRMDANQTEENRQSSPHTFGDLKSSGFGLVSGVAIVLAWASYDDRSFLTRSGSSEETFFFSPGSSLRL